MSTTGTQENSTHRLHDIVVEEVSLVDRAANKHRFLLVKRKDPMQDEDLDRPDDDVDETKPTDAETTKSEDGGVDPSVLEAAVAVLERVTETVETLGTVTAGEARAKLGELGSELRAMADQLVQAAGTESTAEETSGDGDALSMAIESVRSTLQEVGSLLGKTKRAAAAASKEAKKDASGAGDANPSQSTAAPSAAPPSAAPPSAAAPSAAPPSTTPVASDALGLATLTDAVRKLADAMKDQQQRLGRVEKQFGLPASAPPAERVARTTVEDVGWPMDLNRPMDRQSVDKGISFHD